MSQGSAISIENINLSYSDKVILRDFSLFINSGENVIIAGPNGCGKTTLLKILMGLVKPSSGKVDMTERRKGSIAYCGQEKSDSDFPISVREVLLLGIPSNCKKGEAHERMYKALEQTNCKALIDRNFFSLSGGEKQRVSLARCLCQNPSLLLLDEPSTYLDSNGRNELFSILDSLAETELTILMVTHEADLFEHFSNWRLVRMEKEGL